MRTMLGDIADGEAGCLPANYTYRRRPLVSPRRPLLAVATPAAGLLAVAIGGNVAVRPHWVAIVLICAGGLAVLLGTLIASVMLTVALLPVGARLAERYRDAERIWRTEATAAEVRTHRRLMRRIGVELLDLLEEASTLESALNEDLGNKTGGLVDAVVFRDRDFERTLIGARLMWAREQQQRIEELLGQAEQIVDDVEQLAAAAAGRRAARRALEKVTPQPHVVDTTLLRELTAGHLAEAEAVTQVLATLGPLSA